MGYCSLAGVHLFVGVPEALARERVTCVMIRTDETVASVARRVTGDARNMQASWFQIVNPTTSRPVPKTRTDSSSRAGTPAPRWTTPSRKSRSSPPRRCCRVLPSLTLRRILPPLTLRRIVPLPPRWRQSVWAPRRHLQLMVALALALTFWLGTSSTLPGAGHAARDDAHAERFVEEFERPLIQPHLRAVPSSRASGSNLVVPASTSSWRPRLSSAIRT